MGESVTDIWKRIPQVWQAGLIIAAAASAGVAGTLTMAGWIPLPDAVAALQVSDARQDSALEVLARARQADDAKWERVDCILTAMATGDDPVRECGL